MRTGIAVAAWLIAIPIAAAAQGPLKVDTLSLSEPATIVAIDTDQLKGQPARLAWSPDATRLAWLQKDGRKKFVLQVARVSAS